MARGARTQAALRWLGDATSLALATLSPRRSWIKSKHKGAQSFEGARRIAVFVTWDRDNFVHEYVIAHLEGLRAAGFTTIVVSNSRKLTEEAIERLAPLSALVVHRRNRGYDFGGYHDGLRLIPNVESLDGILLINDSTYGPFFDLKAHVLDRMDGNAAQVWSLTDSWEDRFHLQSYFLYATRPALASKAWKKFWKRFLHLDNKRLVVKRYEVGLTQALVRAGIPCRALFSYRDLARDYVDAFSNLKAIEEGVYSPAQVESLQHIYNSIRNGSPMNGSHFLWDRLLVTYKCPYLKRELLTHNPTGVPLAGFWEVAIRGVSTYDPDMIERHLKTINRNRSP